MSQGQMHCVPFATTSSQTHFQSMNYNAPKAPLGHCFPFFISVMAPCKLVKMTHAFSCTKSSYLKTEDEKESHLI